MSAATSSYPPQPELHFRVVGCLRDGFLYTLVGYGAGMLDGGFPEHIPIEQFPADLRMPNCEFRALWDIRTRSILRVTERLFPPPVA